MVLKNNNNPKLLVNHCLLPSEKLQATAEGVTGEGGPELQHLSLGSRAGYSVNIVVKVITPVVVFVTHTPLPPLLPCTPCCPLPKASYTSM